MSRAFKATNADGEVIRAVGLPNLLAAVQRWGVPQNHNSMRVRLSNGQGRATVAGHLGIVVIEHDLDAERGVLSEGAWHGRVTLLQPGSGVQPVITYTQSETLLGLIGKAAHEATLAMGAAPSAISRTIADARMPGIAATLVKARAAGDAWVATSWPPSPNAMTVKGRDWVMVLDIATTHEESPWAHAGIGAKQFERR